MPAELRRIFEDAFAERADRELRAHLSTIPPRGEAVKRLLAYALVNDCPHPELQGRVRRRRSLDRAEATVVVQRTRPVHREDRDAVRPRGVPAVRLLVDDRA